MIRDIIAEPSAQKLPQAQRVGTAPGDAAFRINSFEVADQQHPKVHPRHDSGPTHHRGIELPAGVFNKPVKPIAFQHPVDPFVEHVSFRPRQFLGRDPQRFLALLFPSHAHIASSFTHLLRDTAASGPFESMHSTLTTGC